MKNLFELYETVKKNFFLNEEGKYVPDISFTWDKLLL